MAPLTFEIPPPRAKSFTVVRGDAERLGEEHVELIPREPIRTRTSTIHAFVLSLEEARELGAELIRVAT